MSINVTHGNFIFDHVTAASRPRMHGARFVTVIAVLALLLIAKTVAFEQGAQSDRPLTPIDTSDVVQGP